MCATIPVGLAVDLGGQVHAQQRARDVAAQAARAGGQEVQAAPAIEGRYASIDTAPARTGAERYLAASDVHGNVSISNGNTITVNVTTTYSPTFLSLIGVDRLDVTGTASARLVRSLGGTEQ
jgi:Flp pilus assembly protein TadG